jgi:signal transduction histidine kinase/DNA-binding LacI/PurR family transcriptional regulator
MPDKNNRLTIGLITNQIYAQVFEAQWWGVLDAAHDLDVNLIIYPGHALQSPDNFEHQANLVFKVINPAFFDALIMWTGALDWFVSEAELQAFVSQFASVPLVSMETPIPGAPTVTIGNYQGMWDLVQHLIVVHGYQRLAFIAGPAGHRGMQDRFQAYRDCLQAHNLVFDPDMVVAGDFSEQSGATAVSTLLNKHPKTFDALVVANDKMAIGAIRTLQARGIHVPLQTAVAGFDQDQTTFPPLTTVYPPFYEMGRLALETCVSLAKGQRVPDYTEMPAELVIRRSCGCLPTDLEHNLLSATQNNLPHAAVFSTSQQIAAEVVSIIPYSRPLAQLETLAESFVDSVTQTNVESFLVQLYKTLLSQVYTPEELAVWHQVISVMRLAGKPYWRSPTQAKTAEEICQQARLLVADTERWTHEYQIVAAKHLTMSLHNIGNTLITAFSLEQLQDLIESAFLEIGLQRCAVALYEAGSDSPVQAKLLLAYTENGRCDLPPDSHWHFNQTVMPPPLLSSGERQSYIAAPLYFRSENLGLVVFGIGPREGIVYETLRSQLSSALKRALMVREIQTAQDELETRVEIRTAELQQEIQERQQIAEALRKSEATMRALLAAIPDTIFLVDEEYRFLNFIPSEGLKTAVSLQDYLGLTLFDVFLPELAEQCTAAITQALHTPGILLQEMPITIGPDRRTYEVRLMAVGPGNVLGIIRDITERKENESSRENLIEELETKNAELERFTYTVSHDLKSPLVTIKGFLGFLAQDALSGNVDELHKDIARIRQATDQMQTLLDDLLELSRVGRLVNNREWTPFSQIIAEAISRVEGQIVERGVTVTIQPDLPEVYGDVFRLIEVVQNLLDNGIKYMGLQPQPQIIIGAETEAQEICCFVRDNGIGIDARYHEKIFGLFDRLDHTEEGTGIGLALVKRIIEMHGGRIWVESNGTGHGSIFHFTLPCPPNPEQTSSF